MAATFRLLTFLYFIFHAQSSNSQVRIIHKVWQDDLAFFPQSSVGWIVADEDGNAINEKVISQQQIHYNSSYHYFVGDNSVNDSNDHFYLLRYFACDATSSVTILYTVCFCDTENGDWVKVYVNGSEHGETRGTDNALEFFDDSNLATQSGCNNWKRLHHQSTAIPYIEANATFQVLFEIRITGSNEGIGINMIEIHCDQYFPTNGPTKEPSQAPTTYEPTYEPSQAPTTYEPTFEPIATSYPTLHPTKEPTFDAESTYEPITGKHIIHKVWQDDLAFIPDGGWIVADEDGNGINANVISQQEVHFNTSYHYFVGDNSVNDSNDHFYLLQDFACDATSSMTILYTVCFCDTENGDWVKVYVNGVEQGKTHGTDSALEPFDDSNLVTQSGCNNWKRLHHQSNAIQYIEANATFQILFEIRITGSNEGIGIYMIEIYCDSHSYYPTNEPTNTPTSSINNTKSTPSKSAHHEVMYATFMTLALVFMLFNGWLCHYVYTKYRKQKKSNEENLKNIAHVSSNSGIEITPNSKEQSSEEPQDIDAPGVLNDDALQMKEWLTESVGLPNYLNDFISNGFESLEFIETIDSKSDLSDIKITDTDHQTKILEEIDKLKRRKQAHAVQPSASVTTEIIYTQEGVAETGN